MKTNIAIVVLLIIVIGLQVAGLVVKSSTVPVGAEGRSVEELRKLASQYKSQGLPRAAAETYESLLARPEMGDGEKANILLLIGDLYYNEIKDYEKALAAFVQIRTLYPESEAVKTAELRIVNCLENLDRSREAQRQLSKVVDINPNPQQVLPSDTVVAKVGEDRKITLRELEQEIDSLPEWQREQFETPEKKMEFLQGYIAQEELYKMALRKGLEKDPEIGKQLDQMRKQLLIQKIMKDAEKEVRIGDSDIELYYKAHPESFQEPEKLRVAHIQLPTEAGALEALEALRSGKDFSALAAEKSTDEQSRGSGGVLQPFPRASAYIPGIGRAEGFSETAYGTGIGEVTGPVRTEKGYSLIRPLERIPERVPPLEEIRPQVERMVRSMKIQDAHKALTDQILKAENIAIYGQVFEKK